MPTIKDFQDRRQEQLPVIYDRRDIHARVAVLEIKVDNNTEKLEQSYEVQNRLIEKFDNHVVQQSTRDAQLQSSITTVVSAVTVLSSNMSDTNDTLKEIAKMAADSNLTIVKWDAVVKTLAKLAGIATIVIGAAWSVFTYVDSHKDVKIVEATQQSILPE